MEVVSRFFRDPQVHEVASGVQPLQQHGSLFIISKLLSHRLRHMRQKSHLQQQILTLFILFIEDFARKVAKQYFVVIACKQTGIYRRLLYVLHGKYYASRPAIGLLINLRNICISNIGLVHFCNTTNLIWRQTQIFPAETLQHFICLESA